MVSCSASRRLKPQSVGRSNYKSFVRPCTGIDGMSRQRIGLVFASEDYLRHLHEQVNAELSQRFSST
jgi:hypothetical protein